MSDFTEGVPERKPPRGTEETDFPVPAQPPPVEYRASGRHRAATIITSAIVAALVAIVMVFGLQAFRASLTLGTVPQQGRVMVPAGESTEVYYQVPYTSPPNLTVTGSSTYPPTLVDQQPDHFKVKNTTTIPLSVEWKAEGRPAR